MNLAETVFFGLIAFSVGYVVSYLVMTINIKEDK